MKRCNRLFALAMAAAAVCSQAATAQPKADRYYDIEHKVSGQTRLHGGKGTRNPLHLWGPIAGGQQDRYAFKLVESGEDGCFYLIHKFSGKYVCTEANGAAVHLWGPISPGDEDSNTSSSWSTRRKVTTTSSTSFPVSTFYRGGRTAAA